MSAVALQCLAAAVGGGYVDDPSTLLEMLDSSFLEARPVLCPKDILALLSR